MARKNRAEAKVERVTWFAMVLVFAVIYVLPDNTLPNWTVPTAGAVILLSSGIYQYSRRWRVSPVTWIAATVMLLLAAVNFSVSPELNFFGLVLLIFGAVIFMGVVTGET